ncbi:unnamed protein product, partial [Ectocarpus fasciculatus]
VRVRLLRAQGILRDDRRAHEDRGRGGGVHGHRGGHLVLRQRHHHLQHHPGLRQEGGPHRGRPGGRRERADGHQPVAEHGADVQAQRHGRSGTGSQGDRGGGQEGEEERARPTAVHRGGGPVPKLRRPVPAAPPAGAQGEVLLPVDPERGVVVRRAGGYGEGGHGDVRRGRERGGDCRAVHGALAGVSG